MWSATSIDGGPRLLLIDGSQDLAGWEAAFCDRLFKGLKRRLAMVGEGPVRTGGPEGLLEYEGALGQANCFVVVAHGSETSPPAWARLLGYWAWLDANVRGPRLFAGISWQSYSAQLRETVLSAGQTFAPLALVPQRPVSFREAGLYLLKFFTELALHSGEQITGKMVWFSASKAQELMRRRGFGSAFGVRC